MSGLESIVFAMKHVFIPMAKRMYDPLVAHIRRTRPTIVIADFVAFAGLDAAVDVGVPLVVSSPAPLSVLAGGPNQLLPAAPWLPGLLAAGKQVTYAELQQSFSLRLANYIREALALPSLVLAGMPVHELDAFRADRGLPPRMMMVFQRMSTCCCAWPRCPRSCGRAGASSSTCDVRRPGGPVQ